MGITEFSAGISVDSKPHSITPGPDGNLWFTEATGNRIGRITPSGVITEFSAGITAGDITSGPVGNLWFTETQGRIGRITPAGVVTEFVVGSTNDHSLHIVVDPDGRVWFTEISGNIKGIKGF